MLMATLILLVSCLVIRSEAGNTFEPLDLGQITTLEGQLEEAYNDVCISCTGSATTFAPLAGSVLRLAFHDCAGQREGNQDPLTTDSICDGCIEQAITFGPHQDLTSRAIVPLEAIFRDEGWNTIMSRADFWAFAGTKAVKHTQQKDTGNVGDTINIPYYFGREDCSTSPDVETPGTKTKIFPSGKFGWGDTFGWFSNHFGFNERETVAILGAHTIGTPHEGDSGFTISGDGLTIRPWVSDWGIFNNQYYIELQDATMTKNWGQVDADNLEKIWIPNGNGATGMRLNTDMSLVVNIDGQGANGAVTETDCAGDFTKCTRNTIPAGIVDEFAADTTGNQAFLTAFGVAFEKMVKQGYTANDNILTKIPTEPTSTTTVPTEISSSTTDYTSTRTQRCDPMDDEYMKRTGQVTYPSPKDYSSTTATADDYGCEPAGFCELLGISGQCAKLETRVYVPFYQYNEYNNAGDVCIAGSYFPNVPIDLDIALYCCENGEDCTSGFESAVATQDDTYICPVNEELSASVGSLVTCLIPNEVLAHVQCYPDSYKDGCPEILVNRWDEYQDCACNVLYEELGCDGSEYMPRVTDWVQEYVGKIGSYFGQCGDLEVDCSGLLPDCDCNDRWDYFDDCTDPDPEEGYGTIKAELVLEVCVMGPQFTRPGIWKIIKEGFIEEIEEFGFEITIDLAPITLYRIKKDQGEENGKSTKKKCNLGFNIEINVAIQYPDFDILKRIYNYLDELAQKDKWLAMSAKWLILSIAADAHTGIGFLDVNVETAQVTLYNPDGTEYKETGNYGDASYYSFGPIFAFLFAIIAFN